MELLVWLFIAVLLITYGGALALAVGVVLAVLSVVPWWITLVMVAGWFTKEYAVVVREERAESVRRFDPNAVVVLEQGAQTEREM